jgi:hypothetical protein
MTKIDIPATDESPKVIFDTDRGILEIVGKSLPEDTKGFYDPIINVVQKYVNKPKPHTVINLNLNYLNSSSTKKILELVTHFETIEKRGFSVELNWFYEENDDDMLEEGQEFNRLTELNVNIQKKFQIQ